jgi:hypothetical protein
LLSTKLLRKDEKSKDFIYLCLKLKDSICIVLIIYILTHLLESHSL